MNNTESSHKISNVKSFFNDNSSILVTIIFSLLSAIIVLTFYVFVVAKRIEPQIGSVDLQSLMKDITMSTFKQIDGKDDAQQEKIAANLIKNGSLRLEEAIQTVSIKHHVILIQKQAFVSKNNIVDYTNEVCNEIAKSK